MPALPIVPPLVLASASPRRQALLRHIGVPFEPIPPEIEERRRDGEPPRAFAERLAQEKALAVASRLPARPRRLVLGADTVVVLDADVLGKPADGEDAVRLLARLVGRRHQVMTGIGVADTAGGALRSTVVTSEVSMRPACEREIRSYAASGEPLDKAGGYAAQGEGKRFIERIEGSETNVIGLPIEETLALLRAAGLPLGADR